MATRVNPSLRHFTKEDLNKVKSMRTETMTLIEIRHHFRQSGTAVYKWLGRNNIPYKKRPHRLTGVASEKKEADVFRWEDFEMSVI